MQKIINEQKAISEKIEHRETSRKQFWLNVAHSQIITIIDAHYRAKMCSQRSLNSDNDQVLNRERSELTREHFQVKNWYLPKLDQAMTQIADLLEDPSLYETISHDNYRQFEILIADARDNLEDINHTRTNARLLEERAEVFRNYLNRIKQEMPSKSV